MEKIGYRIFRLKLADNLTRTEPVDPHYWPITDRFKAFTLDPSGLSGGGWANADGTLSDLETAEMIMSEAMKENPDDEFTILPIYKSR